MGDELIAIASGALAARINPLGAELSSLTDAAGAEYMTDADPAYWAGRAPLLFPIVGALAGGHLRHGGKEYALARHGFARRSRFEVVAQTASAVRLLLRDDAATRVAYPFAFALEMGFALEGLTLRMEARVRNPGGEALPFSFGYHPAFAWPLPGGGAKEAHLIRFAEAEPAPIRRVGAADGLLLPACQPSPVAGRDLALDEGLFAEDAVIWDQLASRALAYGSETGPWLDIAFPDSPQLGLWQKPGGRFLCIEPWAGHADPEGFAGDLAEKPGIILLAPGAERAFRMDVSLRPL